jgi:MoaA/NifB/PqqE/SkfB family radical SAM enzyme
MLQQKNKYQYSVEIVGSCNLRCPSCPVGNMRDIKDERPTKLIETDLFYKIIDKITKETQSPNCFISVFDWGEPTLHPMLPKFIEYINNKGLKSRISSNLNHEADFRSIVKANPTEFQISISGFSSDIYSKTHARGNIYKVKSHMYKLRQYADQFKTNTEFQICYHVYKHNFDTDFEDMKKLAKELKFKFIPILAKLMPIEKNLFYIMKKDNKNYNNSLTGKIDITDDDEKLIKLLFVNPYNEYLNWKKQSKTKKQKLINYCTKREFKTPIRVDGSVGLCCAVYNTNLKVVNNFLDVPHEQIHSLRKNNEYCGTCMKHGLHDNWKMKQSQFFFKNLLGSNFISKIQRKIYKKIINLSLVTK